MFMITKILDDLQVAILMVNQQKQTSRRNKESTYLKEQADIDKVMDGLKERCHGYKESEQFLPEKHGLTMGGEKRFSFRDKIFFNARTKFSWKERLQILIGGSIITDGCVFTENIVGSTRIKAEVIVEHPVWISKLKWAWQNRNFTKTKTEENATNNIQGGNNHLKKA